MACIIVTILLLTNIFYQLADSLPIETDVYNAIEDTDFETRLHEIFARDVERVNALDLVVKKIENGGMNGSLKKKYQNPIINAIKGLQKELSNYYLTTVTQSLATQTVPNEDENMFEIKALEILPKYLNQLYTDFMQQIIAEPKIKAGDKTLLSRQGKTVLSVSNTVIESLRDQIESNPALWRDIDLFWILLDKKSGIYANSPEAQQEEFDKLKENLFNYAEITQPAVGQIIQTLQKYSQILYDN